MNKYGRSRSENRNSLRKMSGKLNKCKKPLYDIYESKSQISRKKFDFLQYRAKRAIY